jgi:LmbE family N-acetylglucosaminyl deacetylase
MTWIYFSPHLDDAALSCGGLIAQQSLAGEPVEIWTICAGDPPPGPFSPFAEELHARWQTGREATALRRQEDLAACKRLSAACRHLPVPDCIYRRAGLDYWGHADVIDIDFDPETAPYLYPDREAIFATLHPQEDGLVHRLAEQLNKMLPSAAELVCPLTLGNHVDHQLTRQAAESLGRPLWYYADYPYVLQYSQQIAALGVSGWRMLRFPVSEVALQAWIQSIAAHQSQISTFWTDLKAMRTAIAAYHDDYGGAILWKRG